MQVWALGGSAPAVSAGWLGATAPGVGDMAGELTGDGVATLVAVRARVAFFRRAIPPPPSNTHARWAISSAHV